MESVLSRHRNLIVLLGVLFLQALGLAVQVRRGVAEAHDTRLIRIWAVGTVTPVERCLVWIENSSGNLWHNYFYLRGVRAENRQLKEQIEQMRLEQVRLNEDAAQAHRLQNLLAFKEQFVAKTVAAQVIGSSGADSSRVIYIDKGENAGIARDMAVITADGIVGKVLMVWPSLSQVLLINDQSSGVGAILEKSRLQGVLRGTATGEVELEHIMKDEDVTPGETILTSGGDQIFPKGLHVGTVAKVEKGKDVFLSVKIRPSASLSKLEEVLVLVEKQERTASAEDQVHLRAADILAQRLPSVPEKPVATTTGPGGTAGAAKLGTSTAAVGGSAKPAVGAKAGVAASTAPSAAKPKTTTNPQNAQNAKTAPANSAASNPGQPGDLTSAPPKPKLASTTVSKPPATDPAIVEEKPATPPSIQPIPQTPADDNPH
jgi:rod shape-determining protein MreC